MQPQFGSVKRDYSIVSAQTGTEPSEMLWQHSGEPAKLKGMNQEFVGECWVKYGWKTQRAVGNYVYTLRANAHPDDDLERQYSIGVALDLHGRKSIEELQIVEDTHQASCPISNSNFWNVHFLVVG